MRCNPCMIRTGNLKVNFTGKKCALYMDKYGMLSFDNQCSKCGPAAMVAGIDSKKGKSECSLISISSVN